jgi:hypothetical protein
VVSLFCHFTTIKLEPSLLGVYVPMIVDAILSDPSNGIKISGVAIGDGCLGTDVLCDAKLNLLPPYWDVIFFYGNVMFDCF